MDPYKKRIKKEVYQDIYRLIKRERLMHIPSLHLDRIPGKKAIDTSVESTSVMESKDEGDSEKIKQKVYTSNKKQKVYASASRNAIFQEGLNIERQNIQKQKTPPKYQIPKVSTWHQHQNFIMKLNPRGRIMLHPFHPNHKQTSSCLNLEAEKDCINVHKLDPLLPRMKSIVMNYPKHYPLNPLQNFPNVLDAKRCVPAKYKRAITRQVLIIHQGLIKSPIDLGKWGFYKVRKYIPEPLICVKCQRYEHPTEANATKANANARKVNMRTVTRFSDRPICITLQNPVKSQQAHELVSTVQPNINDKVIDVLEVLTSFTDNLVNLLGTSKR